MNGSWSRYSGASWATIDDLDAQYINTITSWPGYGREEGKAPTALYYDDDTGETHWGYDIEGEASALQWFKLLLLRPDDVPDYIKHSHVFLDAKRILKGTGKAPVDVIADYLKLFWNHIMDIIQRDRGEHLVDTLQIHVVLTVPAIWKGYARQDMKLAAAKAGILDTRDAGPTTLSFAPEPEAAALAAFLEEGRRFGKDEVYIICDAGGGTVDLVMYMIVNTDPIQLHEVGIGGLCGGIFVDEAFRDIVKERLGRKWNNLSLTGQKEIMKKEWEVGIKPRFKPDNTNREHIVSIPAEAMMGSSLDDKSRRPFIKDGRIHFASSDINKAFTGVFSSIEELIDNQIQQARKTSLSVKGIILVGGLGSNDYLYQHLKWRYKPKGVDIIQSTGMKQRTAISCGAIFKGFNDGPNARMMDGQPFGIQRPIAIVSSVARESIGIVVRRVFIEGLHDVQDKEWDEVRGKYMAGNQMYWLVKKDDHKPSTTGTIGKQADFNIKMVPSGATVEFSAFYDGKLMKSQDVDVEYA
ncbi:hypothetical protein PG994_002701 [Apiospora phragmitis]|uniref:Actin-like ATPase domain-containing protein n=1 Tax=Apiospora phragmitis TaxID=2905665 RepID=A0ABR1W5X1_9PEZI